MVATKSFIFAIAVAMTMFLCQGFVPQNNMARRVSSRAFGSASMRMDMEMGTTTLKNKPLTMDSVISNVNSVVTQTPEKKLNFEVDIKVEDAEEAHGMPWTESIAGPEAPLIYMPFWEWQLSFMKENLTNLRVLECSARGSASFESSIEDLSYIDNKEKKSRLVNLCFASDEYRKIRMTYYDAGESCQVFNSVFYPHEDHNLPILGIDILSFNRKKFLAIVDFQPLHQDEDLHDALYEDSILEPIREQYENLKGKMSSKFYDETQFFSKQMLFSRFEEEQIIPEELFPAFREYVSAHLKLVKETEKNTDKMGIVKERQIAYDTYSAERDPATGLFAAMFGKDWADKFVHGFLFSRSEMQEGSAQPQMMGMGGPPRGTHQK